MGGSLPAGPVEVPGYLRRLFSSLDLEKVVPAPQVMREKKSAGVGSLRLAGYREADSGTERGVLRSNYPFLTPGDR